MERTKTSVTKPSQAFAGLRQVVAELFSRANLARRLGITYKGKRKLYQALGYPEDDKELDFAYWYNLYDRQDIANAVINRPCDATWKGSLAITEPNQNAKDSKLNAEWNAINKTFKVKTRLNKADKLCELGRYSVLLIGLDDVKDDKGFAKEVAGTKRKLLYIKQIAESEAEIHTLETKPDNERYGMPLTYKIRSGSIQSTQMSSTVLESKDLIVHHSRIVHYVTGNLTSEIYGVGKLKPILNRLLDIDKILGGDAEMFWRNARPGYTGTEKEDYELGTEAEEALMKQLDEYEHDLRRFITAKGVDIKALEQQTVDPLNHLDAQLQAISAQTGIPKRVLIGSERGELSSAQDADQWKDLIKTRQHEHAEPTILRPLIDYLMAYGIMTKVENYNVMWDDVFAPSEKEKVEVGKSRSESLKNYTDSPLAPEVLPPNLAAKYLLGLNEEQAEEVAQALKAQGVDEDSLLRRLEEEEMDTEAEPQEEEETLSE